MPLHQIILVRTDIDMTLAKMVDQVIRASTPFLMEHTDVVAIIDHARQVQDNEEEALFGPEDDTKGEEPILRISKLERDWMLEGKHKTIFYVNSLEHLYQLLKTTRANGINAYEILDSDHVTTCGSLGPYDSEKLNQIVANLKPLSVASLSGFTHKDKPNDD